MDELEDFIKLFNSNNIILADNIDLYNSQDKLNKNIEIKNDVRSATFYAFGKSKLINKNVVLIVDGNNISSTYTALTEAWFQNTNLIIIALYKSMYDISCNYLNKCSVCNMSFLLKDYHSFKDKIDKNIQKNGPKIFNIVVDFDFFEPKINYENILSQLSNILDKNDEVYVYNSLPIDKMPYRIINIDEKYKYGIISKYVAYLLGKKNERKILVCSSEIFLYDTNILNNKYMSDNFLIILIDKANIAKKISNWCKENKINFCIVEDLSEQLKDRIELNKPSILVIKEEV